MAAFTRAKELPSLRKLMMTREEHKKQSAQERADMWRFIGDNFGGSVRIRKHNRRRVKILRPERFASGR